MTPTDSPCIGVCALAEDEPVCAGCFRTMGEIAGWLRMPEAEKLRVLTAIAERKAVRAGNARAQSFGPP